MKQAKKGFFRGMLERLTKKQTRKVPVTLGKRSFSDALGPARLSYSWVLTEPDLNRELVMWNEQIRDKARSLEISSDYVRRFLSIAEANVVGSEGFRLQVKARKPDGTVDKIDSSMAERLWMEYSKGKNVSIDGRMNLRQIEGFIVRGLLRDGEVFIRKIKRRKDRRFPLKLQFIAPESIDERLNRDATETVGDIIMGIEVDDFGAPVNYYAVNEDNASGYVRGHDRIPASEMIHIFLATRPGQVRGYSALTSAIFALKMLDGTKEAFVTNFRVSAAKMGFFTRTAEGVEYTADGKDSNGNLISDASPGHFELLPVGTEFKEFDPTFPADSYDSFVKTLVRSIASGWGVSYNGLANDYAEVNYSSARVAQLEERELWKKLQKEIADQFLDPLYEDWLDFAILTQTLPVPESKFDKFNEKRFIGRTWTWVDPQNEVSANAMAVKEGFKSRTRVCAEQGLDFEDVVEELAHELELAASLGITLGDAVPVPQDGVVNA